MTAITTRVTAGTNATVKNAPLTNAEIDTNFINLNNGKVETADAVSTNTANKVVARDASGNFAAGTITAALTGNATSATNLANGGAGQVPYNTGTGSTAFLAAGTNGQVMKFGGASAPTWADQSTLSVGSASVLTTARNISIGTGATGTATSFSGGSDITIPITAINADYISSGTVAAARLGTTGAPQFSSLGVGTAASGTTGEIRATNAVTSYYSDERLKENIVPIENALAKIEQLVGVLYTQNALAEQFGYNDYSQQVGLLAGQVKAVQPEATALAPFDVDENGNSISGENYLTVRYERLIPLLVEGIKELNIQIKELKGAK
jgi:hypothetical protein